MRILYAAGEGREAIFAPPPQEADVSQAVRGIIADVRARGDAAVLAYTSRFDGAQLHSLRVSTEEIGEARAEVGDVFLALLTEAAANIRAYHSSQLRDGFCEEFRPGVTLGQKVLPIGRVGLYVPGGTASYPSSVLMNAIPAFIAGCPAVQMVTPPGPDGRIAPSILAAASVAGVTAIFKAGGAQAVAALAYGTDSIPAVDKIVGPGNAYVAEAKRQVFGQVAIDMIAGPSEILIVADAHSDPRHLAADLLSQAEHDRLASAVLVTDSEALARAVQQEVERQLLPLPRQAIARASIDQRGKIIVTDSLQQAMDIANTLAPEHLELCVAQPFEWLKQVVNAGSVFLGRDCPEAMGDYFAGTNHTLPTGGTARFSSALSVDDFQKKIQFSAYAREAFLKEAPKVAAFARMEGLEAHARSVESRMEGQQ